MCKELERPPKLRGGGLMSGDNHRGKAIAYLSIGQERTIWVLSRHQHIEHITAVTTPTASLKDKRRDHLAYFLAPPDERPPCAMPSRQVTQARLLEHRAGHHR